MRRSPSQPSWVRRRAQIIPEGLPKLATKTVPPSVSTSMPRSDAACCQLCRIASVSSTVMLILAGASVRTDLPRSRVRLVDGRGPNRWTATKRRTATGTYLSRRNCSARKPCADERPASSDRLAAPWRYCVSFMVLAFLTTSALATYGALLAPGGLAVL